MKTHILLSLISLFGLLSGCAEHSSLQDTLDKAENFMENHPDSAYSLLQTIDSDALRTRDGRARYALLYTQAQDKNYIDEINDSLISVATNYYQHHGDVRNRFLSLYYKGRVNYNAGDYLHAMLNYSEAETLVPDLQDDYYAGLLYTQMGNIYKKYSDFPKSLEAYCKASVSYNASDRELHKLYSLVNQSIVYRNLGDYQKNDSILLYVLSESKRIENAALNSLALGDLLISYVEQGQMVKAKNTYKELLSIYNIDTNTCYFMTSIIKIHLYDGEYQGAERMLYKAWTRAKTANDSVACYLASSQIYKERGESDKALQEYESGIQIQNRIVEENLQQPVLTMQRDYLAQELEYQVYKRRMNRLLSVVTVLLVTVCVLIVIYFLQKKIRRYYRENLHRRLRQQENENKRKIELLWEEAMQREQSIRQRLDELNREMQQKDVISIEHIRHLQKELSNQVVIIHRYKEQYETLVAVSDRERIKQNDLCISLCRNFFKMLDSLYVSNKCMDFNDIKAQNTAIKIILSKYESRYIKCKDKIGTEKLEETVNLYMNNVMSYFRKEVKLLDEEHYRIMCFLFAGFSGTLIAHLMNTTSNAIYKRKAEIVRKIKQQCPLHTELFLELLRK